MKSPWPASLLGRNLLVVLALVLAGQLAAGIIFRHFVQRPRAEAFVTVITEHLGALKAGIAALPPDQRQAFVTAFNERAARRSSPAATPAPFERLLLRGVSTRLAEAGMPVIWRQAPGQPMLVRLEVEGQAYWLATAGLDLPLALPRAALLIWLLALALSLAGAYLLTRRLHRPLARLAQAARDLGRGTEPPALMEEGPSEIAAVSAAFNAMHAELRRKEEERALMLAGISHDLRTPLTKIRLATEMLPPGQDPELQASLLASTRQMAGLVDRFIDYARDGSQERATLTDIPPLLRQTLAGIPGAEAFQLELAEMAPRVVRPSALARLLANLADNALRHGQAPYRLGCRPLGAGLCLEVADSGPGIPPEALEALRRPFARGDQARGGPPGAGLGLAIADRIAQAEGWRLDFLHPADGGFLIRLTLPAPAPEA